MRYSIVTFGCRVNQADSLCIEEQLRARGDVETRSESADLVIVNTCSVTAAADQGARQAIRRIVRTNPSVRVLVTGCYATRRADEIAALPNVIRVVRNDEKDRFADALDSELGAAPGTAERYGAGDGPCGQAIEPGMAGRTAFTLRVQTGCEERCAYCIIPSTRGHGRSVPVASVVREAERVGAAGFREIVLTGVHLGSYGRDLAPATSLIELLHALAGCSADVLFRVSSLEPMDCTPEIVALVAANRRFAPHFHLPLQHGSDRMLQRMRRPYTVEYYRQLAEEIAGRLPEASIGSDLIVGFPGETNADVDATVRYLSRSPLSHLHVFPYSDRPGTEAASMSEKVDGSEIRIRGARVRAVGAALSKRFRERHVGAVRPALTTEDGTLAVTDNYLKIRIPPGHRRNERVMVRLEDATDPLHGFVV